MLFVAEEVSHTVPSMSWSHLGLEGPGKGNGNSWNICYIPERLFSQEHLPTSLRWSGGYHQLGRPLWRALKGLSPFKTKQNKKNPKIKHGPLSTGRGRNSTILGDFLGKKSEYCPLLLLFGQLCLVWQLAVWLNGESMNLWQMQPDLNSFVGTYFLCQLGYILHSSVQLAQL